MASRLIANNCPNDVLDIGNTNISNSLERDSVLDWVVYMFTVILIAWA